MWENTYVAHPLPESYAGFATLSMTTEVETRPFNETRVIAGEHVPRARFVVHAYLSSSLLASDEIDELYI